MIPMYSGVSNFSKPKLDLLVVGDYESEMFWGVTLRVNDEKACFFYNFAVHRKTVGTTGLFLTIQIQNPSQFLFD